jgi:hypothetical protein
LSLIAKLTQFGCKYRQKKTNRQTFATKSDVQGRNRALRQFSRKSAEGLNSAIAKKPAGAIIQPIWGVFENQLFFRFFFK